jgi:FlaA1/EpsC-like NDP-sugar epimerase
MKNGPYCWQEFLGRPVISIDKEAVLQSLAAKRILITGAGGCIGSALAKQCALANLDSIVFFDCSEKSMYELDCQLNGNHFFLVGDVCDETLLEEIFSRFRPQIIFHAAACKHVPLMEHNPFTAARTNALGTLHVAQVAGRHQCEQLILLSTDKAADPCSIMGASKRIAELVVLANQTSVQMKAVRLGNVLGSSGSVVPLFEKQIAAGGPVTVTHPEAARYFMTMDEAASLLISVVLEPYASTVLVPQLNGPHRIQDLARFLIQKHGRLTDVVFTHLRPGEKLQESLLSAGERFDSRTDGPLRPVATPYMPEGNIAANLRHLQQAVERRDPCLLLETVRALVPEYHPSTVVLENLSQ